MNRRAVVLLFTFMLIGSCAPQPRRAVRPDPPGPVDAIRSIWGDYSSRCPDEYDYCSSRRHSICCPFEQGCCEDSNGAYCCSSRDGHERRTERRYEERRTYSSCSSTEITCSHDGRTICCSSNDGCCAGEDGPYCCAAYESGDRDRDGH